MICDSRLNKWIKARGREKSKPKKIYKVFLQNNVKSITSLLI